MTPRPPSTAVKQQLIAYYQGYDEGQRLQRSRGQQLELLTTLRLIDTYLPPCASLLELGSGHGTYAAHFADRGHRVVASDLVPEHVRIMGERFRGDRRIEVRQIDATAITGLAAESFDAVLCLGPYYHLPAADERRRCLRECRRMVRSGGIVAVAYINKWYAHALYVKQGRFFSAEQYEAFQADRYDQLAAIDPFMAIAHFSTPAGVEQEITAAELQIRGHYAADGWYNLLADSLEAMDEAQFRAFCDHHFQRCADPHTLGASNHGLVICNAAGDIGCSTTSG